MNLLYLAHRVPFPPVKGEKIRSFNHIKHLSRSHTIHVACLVDRHEDWEHVKTLEKWCASVEGVYRSEVAQKIRGVLGVITSKPLTACAQYSAQLQALVTKRLSSGRIDRIILSSSGMAEYVKSSAGIPRIMDFVDIDSEKWRSYIDHHRGMARVLYRVEADRLAAYEETIARTFEHCLVVSEEEAKLLRKRIPSCRVSVVPNGVDLDWFKNEPQLYAREEKPTIVFTGAMDYAPNIDAVCHFTSSVLPLIGRAIPTVQFWIVGSNPASRVRALANDARIVVTGTVADVRPYLAKAWVSIAPLRVARGLQNKVLEAMAMQLPVVGTSAAFQGTQATVHDGVAIADDPHDMANAVVILLNDSRRRQDAAQRARQYVERAHRWEDHVGHLSRILEEMPAASLRLS